MAAKRLSRIGERAFVGRLIRGTERGARASAALLSRRSARAPGTRRAIHACALLVCAVIATALAAPVDAAAADRLVFARANAALEPIARAAREQGVEVPTVLAGVRAVAVRGPLTRLESLSARADVSAVLRVSTTSVLAIEPLAIQATGATAGPCADCTTQYCPEWVMRIGATSSHQASCNNTGTTSVGVAVLDSGVRHHFDLNVASDASFVGASPGNGCVPTDARVGDLVAFPGHGTMVAGAAAAIDNQDGMVGVAPGAPIANIRVIDAGGYTSEGAVICGVNRAVSQGLLVMNLSLRVGSVSDTGTLCSSSALHQSICNAVNQGVSVVTAAGNYIPTYDLNSDLLAGNMNNEAPARYDETLAVTGFNSLDRYTLGPAPSYSPSTNYTAYQWCGISGPGGRDDYYGDYSKFALSQDDIDHTVAASGSCIYSTDNNGTNSYANGTSLAAPAVVGAIALCKESGRCPARDAYATRSIIRNDAAAYNNANPRYGFYGDPWRPASGGRYYGWLICACSY